MIPPPRTYVPTRHVHLALNLIVLALLVDRATDAKVLETTGRFRFAQLLDLFAKTGVLLFLFLKLNSQSRILLVLGGDFRLMLFLDLTPKLIFTRIRNRTLILQAADGAVLLGNLAISFLLDGFQALPVCKCVFEVFVRLIVVFGKLAT